MNDVTSQHEKGIDELLRLAQERDGSVQVSTEEVEEKLKTKIREIEEKKKEEETQQRAASAGLGYIHLRGFPVSPEALALVPEEDARRLQAVCFFRTDREIRVGAVQPEDPAVTQLLRRIEAEVEGHGKLYQISDVSFQAVMKLYAALPKPRPAISGIEIKKEELDRYRAEIKTFRDLAEQIKHVSTTDLFTIVMAAAMQSNASDVHIEAEEDDVKIRFRIDGVLYDAATLPKKAWPKVISRVKLLAKLKINVTDIPQDGRFTIFLGEEYVDVRVSTVPSTYGESVVMRLLMSSAASLALEDIGLVGASFDILKREIERPNGMIVTTGPTGSGKTTTLYAILKRMNKPESKIITLENPVEYRLKGVTQSQVESADAADTSGGKRHFTYATGLRAVLRQDPDIVMVGEIRDTETAEIAIQAALTGHLMLSTLHTNSAAGAIPRLLSMNVKPYLLAPAMNAILGQRLVRRIHDACKEEYAPSPEEQERIAQVVRGLSENLRKDISLDNLKLYRGKGCEQCSYIGYKGRIGVFEMLTMNPDIEKLILSGQVSEFQITEIAKHSGMLTMLQDGVLKALQGITSIEEVFKATE